MEKQLSQYNIATACLVVANDMQIDNLRVTLKYSMFVCPHPNSEPLILAT